MKATEKAIGIRLKDLRLKNDLTLEDFIKVKLIGTQTTLNAFTIGF